MVYKRTKSTVPTCMFVDLEDHVFCHFLIIQRIKRQNLHIFIVNKFHTRMFHCPGKDLVGMWDIFIYSGTVPGQLVTLVPCI